MAVTTDLTGLRRAHQSVTEQTLVPTEILLLTNQCLTDDVVATIKDLVDTNPEGRHEHFPDAHGLGRVLSDGLKRCSEPFVARMDADDIAEPERFAEQLIAVKKPKRILLDHTSPHFEMTPNSWNEPVRFQ